MATATTTKVATSAKKAAAPAKAAPAPAAPMFTMGPWPVKAQSGNSIRAYCYKVASALAKANPNGFTLAQYASALAASAKGSDMKQPSTGWGTADKPNGAAHAHANWFAHAKQGWLSPVSK